MELENGEIRQGIRRKPHTVGMTKNWKDEKLEDIQYTQYPIL